MTSFSEFFHSDDGVRADLRAAGACNALADVRHMGGVIPLPVDDGLIDGDDVLRAHSGAQLTALAAVCSEDQSSFLCHLTHFLYCFPAEKPLPPDIAIITKKKAAVNGFHHLKTAFHAISSFYLKRK